MYSGEEVIARMVVIVYTVDHKCYCVSHTAHRRKIKEEEKDKIRRMIA